MDTLNHPKVKPLDREIAELIGLDTSFIEFVFGTRPACFTYRVENPASGWTCFIPDSADVAYPLWSTNGDQTLVLVSNGDLSFGKGWHDEDDIEMLSSTSQGLLAHLMNAILESDLQIDEVREASDACGFRFLDDLIQFHATPLADGLDWECAFAAFVQTVDEQCM